MSEPVLTPQQKREKLTASYLESYRKLGVDVDVREIEKLVVSDCELVDAADRVGELRGSAPKGQPDDAPPRERPDYLKMEQERTGVRLTSDLPDIWHPDPLYKSARTERGRFLAGRIRRILAEGVTAKVVNGVPQQFYEGKAGPLAYAIGETQALFQLRNQPASGRGFERNKFDGLSDMEALRLYIGELERICDRSTGVFGHWYIK